MNPSSFTLFSESDAVLPEALQLPEQIPAPPGRNRRVHEIQRAPHPPAQQNRPLHRVQVTEAQLTLRGLTQQTLQSPKARNPLRALPDHDREGRVLQGLAPLRHHPHRVEAPLGDLPAERRGGGGGLHGARDVLRLDGDGGDVHGGRQGDLPPGRWQPFRGNLVGDQRAEGGDGGGGEGVRVVEVEQEGFPGRDRAVPGFVQADSVAGNESVGECAAGGGREN